MSKNMHREGQIIGALKQVEAGRAVEDVAQAAPPSAANPEAETVV